MNPNSEAQLLRLRKAIEHSRRTLKPFREHRRKAIKQFVGIHYSGEGPADKVVVPLLALTVRVFLRHLVAKRPRALVSTEQKRLKPDAFKLQLGLNHQIEEMYLGQSLEAAALGAMFSMGFVKEGLASEGDVEIDGVRHDVGTPFADVIDDDDVIWDTAATHFESCSYVGNRYRLPLEWVKESDDYENAGDLKPDVRRGQDEAGDERIEALSRGMELDPDEYEAHVDLWDIYLPREKLLVTLPCQGTAQPIRKREWEGPEGGPYKLLSYGTVPGQINPLPPVALWMDMHTLANVIYRKLGRQAERQKEITAYRSTAAEDAEREKSAADGTYIRMDDPGGVNKIISGGVSQPNMAFFVHLRDLYSWMVGNLDAIGGLSPQSETLGQDRLLIQSASKTIEDLQDRTTQFAQAIIRDTAWYLMKDKLRQVSFDYTIPGTGVSAPIIFDPAAIEGDYLDYAFTIDPYSLRYMDPATKLSILRQVWTQDILPALPLLAQAGMRPNVEAYLRAIGSLSNVPEVADLIVFAAPGMAESLGPLARPVGETQEPRETLRVNRTAGTRMGTDKVMMQTLLGAGVQPAEMQGALSMMR